MPEIKHTFTAGKMNKDLDERLVPNGEYRSALNIQVRTTDGDSDGIGNAGTVQNLEGNSAIGEAFKTNGYDGLKTKFIGSVSDEKSDKAYFFAAAPTPELGILRGIPLSNDGLTGFFAAELKTSRTTWVDSIIEVDTNLQEAVPVFQDVFAVTASKFDLFFNVAQNPQGAFASTQTVDYPTGSYTSILVKDASGIRPGMIMHAQLLESGTVTDLLFADATTDSNIPGVEVVDVQFNDSGTDDRIILLEQQTADLSLATHYKFIHKERVLNFDYYKLITSINIIDDLLFYTDGDDEPKKINIKRSKEGTESNNYTSDPQHTKLFVNGDPQINELQIITDVEGTYPADVQKEHVTVIRKKPINAPTLFMQTTTRSVDVNFSLEYAFVDPSLVPITPGLGTQRVVGGINEDILSSIFINDILEFTDFTSNPGAPVTIRAKVIDVSGGNLDAGEILVEIVFIDEDLSELNQLFQVKLEQNRPLFQTKFGRFAYRYQYEDNEYSAFSPWSELAFLPGSFLYTPSKGFNDGMTNNVRQLIVKDFIPHDSVRPSDVKAIDILWKTTDNANVYIIKTITREINSEWEGFAYDNVDGDTTGRIQITSEMIHRVLPSNQLLRSWDNVPRTAKAQEVTGSRVVYGNYKQGYDINTAVGLKQYIRSRPVNIGSPNKSIKTQREYKFGMVFGDKYGRETPVIANGYMSSEDTSVFGDISVEKNLSALSNKFTVQQDWDENPTKLDWIDYVKYYVKETSNEYYNLVLDRFYNAEDGNIWLSFPSADRNKVDEETYLILKNEHGNQNPVEEKAKYKIIAISNEAPDYIKKDHRVFGKYKISRNVVYDFVYNTDSGVPEGLIKTKKVTFRRSRWEADNIKNSDFKGEKMGRIVAEWTSPAGTLITFRSPYKKISRVIELRDGVDDENGNLDIDSQKQGVVFAESFKKEEVDAYDYFANVLGYASDINADNVDGIAFTDNLAGGYNTSGDDYITYFVEIKDEVVENKPEFDGRFFVKIERDDILNRKVLKQQVGDWTVDEVFEFGYISTETSNPGVAAAPGTDYSTVNWNDYDTTFTLSDTNPENVIGSGENIYLNTVGQNVETINETLNFNFGSQNDQAGDSSISAFFDQSTAIETENFLSWWAGGPEEDPAIANRTSAIFIDNMNTVSYDFNSSSNFGDIELGARSNGISFIDVFPSQTYYAADIDALIGQNDLVNALNDLNALDSVGNAFDNIENFAGYLYYQQIDTSISSTNQWQALATNGVMCKRLNGLHARPGAVANHRNAMWLSVIGPKGSVLWKNSEDLAGNNLATFKSIMQTEGTLFRFRGDPNPNVYKVQKNLILDIDSTTNFDYYGPINLEIFSTDIFGKSYNFMNYPTDTDDDSSFKERHSILVHFVRIDSNGNPADGEGVDVSVWDPRSTVQHNGVGSIVIDVLEPLDEELSTESMQTNSACWETEPKEEVDLDIYYEASDCIPIKLKSNNIQSFIKSSSNIENASVVTGYQRISSSGNVDLSISELPVYACEVYGDDGVKLKTFENGNLSDYNTTVNDSGTFGIAINDVIQFVHKSGLVTRAKVIDHYTTDTYNNVQISKPATRISTFTTNLVGGSNTFAINAAQGDVGAISVGMEVILTTASGENTADTIFGSLAFIIEPGSFVTSLSGDSELLVTLSKPISSNFNNTVVDATNLFINFIQPTGIFKLEKEVWKYPVDLAWFNCYSFGNGVESDRIRDDFNAPQIDNGCRVSSTFLEYGEEKIGSGMIYSGLYNSISSVNNLNEFNMAEKITKNLNPSVGSIQAMKTRDTDVIVFAEDKVLRVLSNKDAVFNADGNTNLTATSKVLGTAIPYVGDYGISKNPESLAVDQYRMYFTDKQRGAVLRLSRDGLTPISNVGMKSYFRETLKDCEFIVGNFDIVNGEYNISLALTEEANECSTNNCPLTVPQSITVSFNEGSKAWVSFKSFVFSTGLSCNGKYLTTPMAVGNISNLNDIWMHYSEDATRNKFYDKHRDSEIEVIFNDEPSIVKSFKTLGYTGSQAQVNKFSTEAENPSEEPSYTDGEFYNLAFKPGWYVDSFNTNLQEGNVSEFINKENKWYNKITGVETTLNNLDASEISVQGIGFPLAIVSSDTVGATDYSQTNTSIIVVAEPLVIGNITSTQLGYGIGYSLDEVPQGGIPPYSYSWGLVGTLVASQFTDEFPTGFFPNLNTGGAPVSETSFNVTPSFNNQTFNNGGVVQCTVTDSSDTPQSVTITSSLTEFIYPE